MSGKEAIVISEDNVERFDTSMVTCVGAVRFAEVKHFANHPIPVYWDETKVFVGMNIPSYELNDLDIAFDKLPLMPGFPTDHTAHAYIDAAGRDLLLPSTGYTIKDEDHYGKIIDTTERQDSHIRLDIIVFPSRDLAQIAFEVRSLVGNEYVNAEKYGSPIWDIMALELGMISPKIQERLKGGERAQDVYGEGLVELKRILKQKQLPEK